MRSLLLVTSILALALTACGALADTCLVPAEPSDALALLQGRWKVFAFDDSHEGEIRFDGDQIETRWEENTLYGHWRSIESGPNRHLIELWIDSADEGGVRQTYGRFDVVDLTLVFGDVDRLYALQSEGTWTWWDRVIEAPVEPGGDAPMTEAPPAIEGDGAQ